MQASLIYARMQATTSTGRFSMTKLILVLSIVLVGAGLAAAQTEKPAASPTPASNPQTPEAPPAANPADVSSIDAIIAAVYDVISGPAERNATGIACDLSSYPVRG